MQAAENGDTASILRLVREGAEPFPGPGSPFTKTALHWAAFHGNLPAVRVLCDMSHDIDAVDPGTNATALHHASDQGDVSVIEELLSRGACPDATDLNGRTPLHRCAFYHSFIHVCMYVCTYVQTFHPFLWFSIAVNLPVLSKWFC
jgi:ankyrin repeat protein